MRIIGSAGLAELREGRCGWEGDLLKGVGGV